MVEVGFIWGEKAKAFTRAIIEAFLYSQAVSLGDVGQRGSFGEVLANKAVCVFVCTAFPGVVRSGEVEGGAEFFLNIFIAVELSAVVRGDGMHLMRTEQFDGALLCERGGGLSEGAQSKQASLALDDGDHAGFALPVNGVDFPIVASSALLDDSRAFANHAFAREAPPAVGSAVAFAAVVGTVAQMQVERSSALSIGLDPQINRLVAHDRDTLLFGATNDLLRTEILAQETFDLDKVV